MNNHARVIVQFRDGTVKYLRHIDDLPRYPIVGRPPMASGDLRFCRRKSLAHTFCDHTEAEDWVTDCHGELALMSKYGISFCRVVSA